MTVYQETDEIFEKFLTAQQGWGSRRSQPKVRDLRSPEVRDLTAPDMWEDTGSQD